MANGIYKGETLAEILKAHPKYLSTKVKNGELPARVESTEGKKDYILSIGHVF